jgi:hypothetical protein
MYLLFIAYLTAAALTQYEVSSSRMMANELEGMWKEAAMLIRGNSRHLRRGTKGNHENYQRGDSMSRPRFELGTY